MSNSPVNLMTEVWLAARKDGEELGALAVKKP
jgi:hypothetical protein